MRLIYVTGSMPFGPGEVFIIEEIRELIRRGHQVLVVPRSPGRVGVHGEDLLPFTKRERLYSARVLRAALGGAPRQAERIKHVLRGRMHVRLKNAAVVPKGLWLAAAAREFCADHIHCHWAGTTASMAMLASEVAGIPWSLTAHRSDIAANNLLCDKVRSAQFVRVISQDGFRMMLSRGVPPDPKIRLLHMGVRVGPAPLPSHTAGGLGMGPEVPVVFCPADFLEVKGHRFLLQAWKILKGRGVPGELWLAGRGKQRESLEEMVSATRLARTVKFLGPIKNSALLDFYRRTAISVVALASIDLGNGEHEGIPVALMEAMSFGVPVVATRTGGIPELVEAETGLLVPQRDAAALADAIEAVIGNPPLAAQLGRSGRRRVAEAFNVTHVVSDLERWFSSTGSPAKVPAAC